MARPARHGASGPTIRWTRRQTGPDGKLVLAAIIASLLSVICVAILLRPGSLPKGLARLATAHSSDGWASGMGGELAREPIDNAAAINAHQTVSDACERLCNGLMDAPTAADQADGALPGDAANELTQWYAAWLAMERLPESPTREREAWQVLESRLTAAPPAVRCTTYERQYAERAIRVFSRYCERTDTPYIITQELFVSAPSIILPRLMEALHSITIAMRSNGDAVDAAACAQRVTGFLHRLIEESPSHGTTLLAADLLRQWAEWQITAGATMPATATVAGNPGTSDWRGMADGARHFCDDLLANIDSGRTSCFVGHATHADGAMRLALLSLAACGVFLTCGLAGMIGLTVAAVTTMATRTTRTTSDRQGDAAQSHHAAPAPVKSSRTVTMSHDSRNARTEAVPAAASTMNIAMMQLICWSMLPLAGVALHLYMRWASYRPWPGLVVFATVCGVLSMCAAWVWWRRGDRATIGAWLMAVIGMLFSCYALVPPQFSSRIERSLPAGVTSAMALVSVAVLVCGGLLWAIVHAARQTARCGVPARPWFSRGVCVWLAGSALALAVLIVHGWIDRRATDSLVARSQRVSAILGDDWSQRHFGSNR